MMLPGASSNAQNAEEAVRRGRRMKIDEEGRKDVVNPHCVFGCDVFGVTIPELLSVELKGDHKSLVRELCPEDERVVIIVII
ncbi:hypothetical protein Plhal304r1_c005g0021011 [Plasmopara halstedii]